ncbi:MAG: ComEC/Rec2 family competence protein [Mucilaginibacter sp.]|uniref:ComEC/Rec2 family competence protein n=1 Tax=Mucilaginibacter sp. TaxID=1882438 RepID=UPI0032674269
MYPCAGYILGLEIAVGILLLAFIVLNVGYQKFNLFKVRWIGGVLAGVMLFLAGIIALEANRESNSAAHFSKQKSTYLIGQITSEPKLNNGILRFTTRIEQGGDTGKLQLMKGNLMVSVKIDTAKAISLVYGDRLIIPTNFTNVEAPLNPAEFNYKVFLVHQNIYQQAFLIQYQVTLLQHDAGNPMIAYALKLRLNLVNKLKSAIRDTDVVAVASTIILGYRADLRKEVQEAYAKTGTMHLLSVAGMHVGLIYLMITFLLSFLPHGKRTKLIKIVVSILLIWFYALITGFSAPVCRAVVMLTMVIIGFSFNRHINRLNVLAVSAFILLLYNPFYICDAGFQLSYMAVFGIIIIQPYVYKWAHFKNWIAREIWLVASVSLAAQIILFPLGALYFHDFPVYFLLSNVFIILPSMIVMYAGIFFLALPHIPIVSASLGWLLERTITIMTKTLSLMEHAPFGSISKIWLSPLEFILAYAIIIGTLCFLIQKNRQWLKFSLVLGLLVSISFSLKAYNSSNTNAITFFSLRKNTGILFRNGNSGLLLTDLNAKDKAYQYSIQPYLDSCRVTKLKSLSKDTDAVYISKRGHLIHFNSQTILLLDGSFDGKTFPDKLNIDYLYIIGNPRISLQYLKQNFNFKQLIADGSNSTRLLNQLEQETKLGNFTFINLKRNKAAIWVSN